MKLLQKLFAIFLTIRPEESLNDRLPIEIKSNGKN